jgi:hypothetical protein
MSVDDDDDDGTTGTHYTRAAGPAPQPRAWYHDVGFSTRSFIRSWLSLHSSARAPAFSFFFFFPSLPPRGKEALATFHIEKKED